MREVAAEESKQAEDDWIPDMELDDESSEEDYSSGPHAHPQMDDLAWSAAADNFARHGHTRAFHAGAVFILIMLFHFCFDGYSRPSPRLPGSPKP